MLVCYNSAFLKWIREYIKMIFSAACRSCHIYITVRNEVAKVMFSQVSVCLLQGGVPGSGGGGIPACTEADPPGEMATAADGTHPTGMHSCLIIDFRHRQSMLSQVNRGFSNFGTFEKTRVAKYTPNEPKTCLLLFGLSSPLFHIIANSRNISLDKVGINVFASKDVT